MTTYRGITYEVKLVEHIDEYDNPRRWDSNLGKLLMFGKYKSIGDSHTIDHNRFDSWDELQAEVKRLYEPRLIIPVYGYCHGGLAIRTSRRGCFADGWDAGQLGFIIATAEDIRNWFQVKNVTKNILARAEENLQNEVEYLNAFLTGDMYEVKIKEPFDLYYGNYFSEEDAIQAAKAEIDFYLLSDAEIEKLDKEILK